MNYTWIAGHLGADPETRFTSSGQKVTTLRVAVKSRKGKNEETIWWRVTIWGEQFDRMMPYFKKGSPIIVNGEMQKPEIFNDREGKPQVSVGMVAHHISFSPFGLKSKEGQGSSFSSDGGQNFGSQGSSRQDSNDNSDPFNMGGVGATLGAGAGGDNFSDEEIPF